MVAAFAVSILAGTGVAPAAAMQDPGKPQQPVVQQDSRHCFLTWIGPQFVRCDDLTGGMGHRTALSNETVSPGCGASESWLPEH